MTTDPQSTPPQDDAPTSGRRPWTDEEKAQIRFLLRALVTVVAFVIVASLVVGIVVSIL